LLHIGQYIQSNAWGLTSKTVLATEHYAVKKAREKKNRFLENNARTIVGVNHHSQPEFAFVVNTDASNMIHDDVE